VQANKRAHAEVQANDGVPAEVCTG
jgi:hypothetical protein